MPANKAIDQQKRRRRVGYLVPNVLLNQQPVEISHNGMDLEEMLNMDTQVDLVLVVGTSLKTEGTYKLVKRMIQEVHHNGGVAIYVDKSRAEKRLALLFDLQLQVDIEHWADCMVSTFSEVREEFVLFLSTTNTRIA